MRPLLTYNRPKTQLAITTDAPAATAIGVTVWRVRCGTLTKEPEAIEHFLPLHIAAEVIVIEAVVLCSTCVTVVNHKVTSTHTILVIEGHVHSPTIDVPLAP